MMDILDLHSRLCCQISKQEIPEVTEAVSLIQALVKKNWKAAYKSARQELLEQLEEYPDDPPFLEVAPIARAADKDSAADEVVALLLALFLARVRRPWSTADLELARRTILRLSEQGARVFSADLDPRNLRTQQLYQFSMLDVGQITAGHLALATPKIEAQLRIYLTQAAARRQEAAALAILRPQGALSRPVWLEALDAAAGASGAWAEIGTDSWGYRTWNAAGIEGALARGVEAIQIVNNPPGGPDAHTTPFCRWIHGRVFPIVRVKKFIDHYRETLLAGDAKASLEAWPWLKNPRSKDEKAFRVHVKQAPLPPYHGLCRSQAFPV